MSISVMLDKVTGSTSADILTVADIHLNCWLLSRSLRIQK